MNSVFLSLKYVERLAAKTRVKTYQRVINGRVQTVPEHNDSRNTPQYFYHGTATGLEHGSTRGIHIGTHEAAREALEAEIGIPAEGEWDGTREYGKTKLAGRANIKKRRGEFAETGYNAGSRNEKVPEQDYYPSERKERATFSDGTPIPYSAKPNILRVKIVGAMSNTPDTPHGDWQANGLMARQLKRGNAKRGYYYKNIGEDAGSISAVVPNVHHLSVE